MNNKNFWSIAAGLAAGAAAGYYLNSDKGREARKTAATKANEYSESLKNAATGYVETAKQGVSDITKSVKSTIGEKFSKVSDEIEQGMQDAEIAVKRAEKKVKTI